MAQLQVSLLVFFAVIFAVRAGASRIESKSDEVVSRVKMFSRQKDSGIDTVEKVDKRSSLLSALAAVSKGLTPKKILARTENDLIAADIPLKAEEWVVIQLSASLVPAILAALAQNAALALLFAGLGAYLPVLFLKNARARRVKKFNDQLGDAITIMANSLRAGFSFLQSMDAISKELPAPISTEFGRALKEMRLGTTAEEAFQNLTQRIASEDLELIVTAVNIQKQVGGNLAQILDNIATTINERVRIKGEIKTLTAQGRISGLIIVLLPIFLCVAIFLMNPSYIGLLFTHPLGIAMVVGAVISELIGIVSIKKIINIEM